MTPLQQIAMGLLLVVIDTATAWDVLPDPLGWLLALPAVALLPRKVRRPPLVAGIAAAVVSALTWPPAGRNLVAGLDSSIDWLVLLVPDLAFGALLCWALGRLTSDVQGSERAGGAWPTLAFLFAVAALGPVPFLAADSAVPGDLALLTQLCWMVLLVLLLWWNKAPWAPARTASTGRSPDPRG